MDILDQSIFNIDERVKGNNPIDKYAQHSEQMDALSKAINTSLQNNLLKNGLKSFYDRDRES